MILVINTADVENIQLLLWSDKFSVAKKIIPAKYQQAEKLLLSIDRLLKANNANVKSLKGVAVVSGPGPFSALRIGIAVANTLSYALNVPVVGIKPAEFGNGKMFDLIREKFSGLKKNKFIKPYYDKNPNITLKK